MQSKAYKDAEILSRKHIKRKRWYTIIVVMATFVMLCTTYALIVPAITMEKEVFCGISEHTHSDGCYTVNEQTDEKELLCMLTEHIHSEECYNEELFIQTYNILSENVATEEEANSVIASGNNWELTADGTLTVTASGAYSSSGWYSYREQVKHIRFGSNITSISSLYTVPNLESIYFEEGSQLTKLGTLFKERTNLKSVDISNCNMLQTLDYRSFYRCKALTDIKLPASLTALGGESFYECTNLEYVEFAENSALESIGRSCFYRCTSLKEITLQENLTSIGENAFTYCSNLTEINIPASLKTINDSAFQNCSALRYVNIPENSVLETIGKKAFGFYNSSSTGSLESINIPASVVTIGDSAFMYQNNLQNIIFADNNELVTIGNYAFSGCPASQVKEITISSKLQNLGNSAFSSWQGLEKVVFEEGCSLTAINDHTFFGCPIKEITIPACIKTIGSSAFYGSKIETLQSIKFEEGSVLESIGDSAFAYQPINQIELPASLTNIGKYAFRFNYNLEEITIPANVKTIEAYCFDGCNNLERVTFEEDSNLEKIGSNAFGGDSGYTDKNGTYHRGYTKIQEISIPSSVVTLESGALSNIPTVQFEKNSHLKNVGSNAMNYFSYRFDIQRLSAAAVLASNSVGANSTVTVEINESCNDLTANDLNSYLKAVFMKYVVVDNSTEQIHSDFLSSLLADKDTELVFDANVNFEMIGNFYPRNSRYPNLKEGKYCSDSNGALYRIEDGKAYLAYCPASAQSLTVPSNVGGYPVVGVGMGAFISAADVKEVTFENPTAITTVSFYAFANAVNLEKVNGCGIESDIKTILSNCSEFGKLAFYNTKIQSDTPELTLNTNRIQYDEDFSISTECDIKDTTGNIIKNVPRDADGNWIENQMYTGQNATVKLALSNLTNTTSKSYNVYFWFMKSNGFLNFAVGEHVLDYESHGQHYQCTVTVNEMDIPGLYRLNIPALEEGATLTVDVPVYVTSPNKSGDKMIVWVNSYTEDSTSSNDIELPTEGNYNCAEWIVHQEAFKVSSDISKGTTAFRGSDDGEDVSLQGSLACTVKSNIVDSNGKIEGVGEDFIQGIDYLVNFNLSEGMHWNDKVVEAVNNGNYIVEYPKEYTDLDTGNLVSSSGKYAVIYTYINNVKTQIGKIYNSNYSSGYYLKANKVYFKDNQLYVDFTCDNPKSTQQEIYNTEFKVNISKNVIMADSDLIQSHNTDTVLTVSSSVTETVRYTHSQDRIDSSSCSVDYNLEPGKLNITKEGSPISTLGYGNVYSISVTNLGSFPYDCLKYVADPLPVMQYIDPDNIEKMMFKEENGKYLTIKITEAELCEVLNGNTTVIGTDGSLHNVETGNTANDTPHSGMERNSSSQTGHNVHTKNNTILLISSQNGFKVTVTDSNGNIVKDYNNKQYSDEPGQIKAALCEMGFIVTADTRYTVIWDHSDQSKVLDSNQTRNYKIYATNKNSFMIISEDKHQRWYENSTTKTKYLGYNYVYVYGSEKYPQYPENTANFSSSKCDGYATNGRSASLSYEAEVITDYAIDGVNHSDTPELIATIGDEIDYSVTFKYKNVYTARYVYEDDKTYRAYEVVPLVDRLAGAQVLIVPVEGNENCDWVNDDIEKYTDKDGVEYYVLNKAGTYKNVNVGGYIADRVEVTKSESGLETLTYWYMTDDDKYNDTIKLKTVLSPTYSGVEANGTLQMSNEAWLGDHTHHRLWDTVDFSASVLKSSKNIVIEKGEIPANDEVTNESFIYEGTNITYRLDLIPPDPNSSVILTGENIYDALPASNPEKPWTKDDIVELKFVNEDGKTVDGLTNGDHWSVSYTAPGTDENPDNTAGNTQQYIVWDNDFSLTLQGKPVYIYVTLKVPSADDWKDYSGIYEGQKLTNKFYVNGDCSTVYHEIAIPGEAILTKGVIANVYKNSGYINYNVNGYDNPEYDSNRFYYSNNDKNTRYVAYYITLCNSGKSKLYVDEFVDILPKGFDYDSTRIYGVYQNGSVSSSTSSYNFINSWQAVKVILPDGTEPNYLNPATVTSSYNNGYRLPDGRRVVKYGITLDRSHYDSKLEKYYLKSNEAVTLIYIAKVGSYEATEDWATNNVAMKYYDYNGAGVKLSNATVGVREYLFNKKMLPNDGKSYLYDYGQAAAVGFPDGDVNTMWLASDVTVQRGKFVPGIVKSVNKVTQANGRTSPNKEHALFTDTISWELNLTNDGSAVLTDYTVTDVMQYPFRFTGQVTMTRNYPNGKDGDINLIEFLEWSADGTSVEIKDLSNSTLHTVTVNDPEWTQITGEHTFGVRISQDSESNNLKLELHFEEEWWSIPEMGSMQMFLSTIHPGGSISQENKIYVNHAYITPELQFDNNEVTRGDTLNIDDKPSVHNVAQIFVSYGNITTSDQTIEQTDKPTNFAESSSKESNFIVVPNSDTGVTYTLKVTSRSEALRQLIIIDNLPEENDHETYDDSSSRGSEFKINLANDPNFRVYIKYPDGTTYYLRDDEYTVEFSDAVNCNIDDRRGGGTGWYSEPKDTTRSFRVIIKEPDDTGTFMPAMSEIGVQFDGDIEGIPKVGTYAWNSFGYSYDSHYSSTPGSYLDAAPLKVGVRIPEPPYIQKSILDDENNSYPVENDATFRFIVYEGEVIEGLNTLTDESEIANLIAENKINDELRKYTYIELKVEKGQEASEKLYIDGVAYTYNNGWVETEEPFIWTDNSIYTVMELPLSGLEKDFKFGNIGNITGNTYSFTYQGNRTMTVNAMNYRNLWRLNLLKTNEYNQPLADAVFAFYSPYPEEQMNAADIEKYTDELQLSEQPQPTITNGEKTYYLKSMDKTPASGLIYWTALKNNEYLVIELKAPQGYLKSDALYYISSPDLQSITYTIENPELKYEIPSTGGYELYVYVFGGLLTATAVLLLYKHFKCRKEEEI